MGVTVATIVWYMDNIHQESECDKPYPQLPLSAMSRVKFSKVEL